MTIYHQRLVDTASGNPFVAGDHFDVTRVVTDIPAGESLAKVWLTIKNALADADGAAVLQKVITTTLVPGVGQITDSGAGTGIGAFRFDVTGAESLALGTLRRFYDIQVKLTGTAIATLEQGTVRLRAGVTAATT